MQNPNQKLITEDQENEDVLFLEDEVTPKPIVENWKILIVDDEIEVHQVTKLALKNFSFEGKGLSFISAYSGETAKQLMQTHPDIAIILLDVVMEKDDSGLEFITYIRSSLKNNFVRIILRTGQPGKAPENMVVLTYEISDYKTKTELTKPKLLTTIVTALRTYSALTQLDYTKQEMQKLAQENAQLYLQTRNYAQTLAATVEERTQELKAKETRLAEAQKIAHLCNFEYDIESKKLSWSEEMNSLLGLDRTIQLTLELIEELIYHSDVEAWKQSLKEIIQTGKDCNLELRIVHPDNTIKYFFVKQRATKNTEGKVTKIFSTLQDITDRKQIEAVLQDALELTKIASNAKSEFIANISHELRNPLNGILGYAQILQLDNTTTAQQKAKINIIYQSGSYLLTLINDLLDIARIEAKKMELVPTAFHFPTFLSEIQQICRIRAEQKHIAFIYQLSPQLPTAIYADEGRLRQILINLLGNAIKFTNTGSVTLKIDVLQPDNKILINPSNTTPTARLRFQIEDTGIGMTPQQLSKIFIPFEQVAGTPYKAEGIGLGLAITHNLVALMKGKIAVQSTFGKGSNFCIELEFPIAADIDLTSKQPANIVIGFQGQTKKILVVDDTVTNRLVIKDMLEPIGFDVIEAENGQEGIEKVTQFKPDLIITNLMMPIMDGLEMTKQLRRLPEGQNTMAIASSASVFEVDRQRSQEAGCNDFLAKPIKSEELLEKIQNCLDIVWITEALENTITDSEENQQIIAPPVAELVTLYQAAQIGDIAVVEAEAMRLRQLDRSYLAFANKLLQFAQEFEEEEVLKLIEQFISQPEKC